ncbi:hypothetical protein V1507DRAFT_463216 [Lipomyces tetrasporus]
MLSTNCLCNPSLASGLASALVVMVMGNAGMAVSPLAWTILLPCVGRRVCPNASDGRVARVSRRGRQRSSDENISAHARLTS